MSPRPAVLGQALALFAALLIVTGVSGPTPEFVLAALVFLVALVFGTNYLRFAANAADELRRSLDFAMTRWCAVCAGIPTVAAIVVEFGGRPWVVRSVAASTGATVAGTITTAVYCGSLFDWFYVLPRLTGTATWIRPCAAEVNAESRRWRFLTQFWIGWRLVVEAISVLALCSGFAYLAATTGKPLWEVVASLAGVVVVGIFVTLWPPAYTALHDPHYLVGQVFRKADNAWGARARTLYTVDVDVRNGKCMFVDKARLRLDGRTDPSTAFARKLDTSFSLSETVDGRPQTPPCTLLRCTGVNWYCPYNPKRYEQPSKE